MSLQQTVREAFAARYGEPAPVVVRAPGRVNLIGEHTDYNDGFVLPMAIDRAVWIALRPRRDRQIHVHSLDLDAVERFDLADLRHTDSGWIEYLKGVAWALGEAGYALQGWEGVMAGDVPRGAGLSSSAAIELATARAFHAVSGFDWDAPAEAGAFHVVSGFDWDAPAMARAGQRAENDWVGVNCGIMDQMISAAGQAGHALLIDCRSLGAQAVPLPAGTAVVILDTATRRGLVESAYNERRAQCEAAARYFGVRALRDVSVEQFAAQAAGLDDVTLRRARHVITENARTLAAADAMRRGDAAGLGRLMDASHTSLRDDFEVTNDALNVMVACAQQAPGCYGARMTGAGFGGCAVALVDAERATVFAEAVADRYQTQTAIAPAVYVCTAADGASREF
jgi:galactokinase